MQARSQAIEQLKTSAPRPSRPSRAVAGTRQFSRTSSAMGAVRSPILSIFFPTLRPVDTLSGVIGEIACNGQGRGGTGADVCSIVFRYHKYAHRSAR